MSQSQENVPALFTSFALYTVLSYILHADTNASGIHRVILLVVRRLCHRQQGSGTPLRMAQRNLHALFNCLRHSVPLQEATVRGR